MSSEADEEQPAPHARRASGERRRYNRRTTAEMTPPYFETFERIAHALEDIRDELARGRDDGPRWSGPGTPAPRGSDEDEQRRR